MIILSAGAAWCLFVLAAIALGGLRDRFLGPRLGIERAQRWLTMALCLVIFLGTWVLGTVVGPLGPQSAWCIGVVWTLATLVLETVLGRCLLGLTWSEIAADYRLWRGRLWPLVPVSTFMAPGFLLGHGA